MDIRLATINLQSRNPEDSRRFYTSVLGMAEDPRRSQPPDFFYLTSAAGHVTVAPPEGPSEGPASSSLELGFEVDDFDGMKAKLERLGLTAPREQAMGWGRAMELRDPDGHRILVYAFPARP